MNAEDKRHRIPAFVGTPSLLKKSLLFSVFKTVQFIFVDIHNPAVGNTCKQEISLT